MDKRKRLLIVTRDGALGEWLEEFFRRHDDLEGDILHDAYDVAQRIVRTRPDALLLDVPSAGGFDVTIYQTIRELEPYLPIITVTEAGGAKERLASLQYGAYSSLPKPLPASEEVYCIVRNAIVSYRERQESAVAASEMKNRCEADRLNLLELELVKGLQHMIGETEEPASILKHSFSLIRNYLSFEVFAALIPGKDEVEIYVYPNVTLSEDVGEAVTGTLIKKMARLAAQEKKVRVVIQGKAAVASSSDSDDLTSIIVPLITSSRTYGYAGIYRGTPFGYEEESVFKRFCAHMATALEKIRLFEEIKSLSVCDGLTGLYNHLFIVSKLEREAQRSERYGSPLSVIMFDIDNFKEINDTFGHLAGDAVLVETARVIKNGVRGIDSVGRYGGEEFLVILPETDGSAAAVIGDRLRQKVEENVFSREGRVISVSLSGGVASFREGRDAGTLIGIADENLYEAKSEGKNMVHYDEK
jgi:diguanylate cyclase (GGDEF)-like protein